MTANPFIERTLTESRPALEIQNLSFAYRSNWLQRELPAIHNLSLTVQPGESFAFLGHNGAGKTTTIKCILNLVHPTQGDIKIFGVGAHRATARHSVGYLPEQPYFYNHLTVYELVEMYAALYGLRGQARATAVIQALDAVNVSARAKSPLKTLSKGITQRVAMAQAIVNSPTLLILDEPFSGLDPIGRREFRDLIVELRAIGTTIFMSSHILGDVQFLCDRAAIMSRGELKGIFDLRNLPSLGGIHYELALKSSLIPEALFALAAEVVTSPGLTRLKFWERETAERALAEALKLRVSIESFTTIQGSLEDLFVQLVQFNEAGGDVADPMVGPQPSDLSTSPSVLIHHARDPNLGGQQ